MYRYGQEEIDAVASVFRSGNLFKINGGAQEVFHFEEELKQKFQTDYAVLMTSGKAALISGLIGLGVGPGDEVIVPAYTYIATAIAVTAVGAIPVIAEVDETMTLDPADFEAKISSHTKAVIPVHILGLPCNMDAINAVAARHNVAVLEDACQSVGGYYRGRALGTIGAAGAYSFNYFKVIGAGEGGCLVTNNKTIFEKGLIHHDSSAIAYFGNQLENVNEAQFCGTEFRVSEITGAIMRVQLGRLDGIVADLRKNRDYCMEALASDFRFIPYNDKAGSLATALCFLFETPDEALAFKQHMAAFGPTRPIETGKHVYANWTPVMEKNGAAHPLMDPFKMEANRGLNCNYSRDMCPRSLDAMSRMVYIGMHPDAGQEALDKLVAACRAFKA